ncbi:MAG: NAD(P)-binding domain-containing protein [Chloroflexota bacterium]|nr:NAD(P)-binding domain-containing protein [Chloroflexota bacterium]MDE2942440.1 NAD(P)-binding domain-containing protein [Chloroflexota bacterium]MDE3267880.1 NAD(P)-binding domain-containing protein [Chloroflexota bacterium]
MSKRNNGQWRDKAPKGSRLHEVAIVGAGAAGLGCGVALKEFGVDDVIILDRHEVGASFRRWPQEMRFITPSFTSNAFGMLDLNAIVPRTSPAFTLDREHPSGAAYAKYLDNVVTHFELRVKSGIDVCAVAVEDNGTFTLTTTDRPVRARHLIWAAGEFQYPNRNSFAGAECCCHSSDVSTWRDLEGDRFTVIGGYESAADAAISLVQLGKNVTVLARYATWKREDPDPSISLSPYSRERLEWADSTGCLDLVDSVDITSVREDGDAWVVQASDGREWTSETRPILATGFKGSLSHLDGLIEYNEDGAPVVTEEADESTLVPGLFISGPILEHRGVNFCFIYKFRQRFAIVADSIAQRLGMDTTEAVAAHRVAGMYLDDLSCCEESCAC